MSNLQGFARTAAAGLGLIMWAATSHAQYHTQFYVEFPKAKKMEEGIVVKVLRISHTNKGGDRDWILKTVPADCKGELYGRNCATEHERFLQIFWDAAQTDYRKGLGRLLSHFAADHQADLTNAGITTSCPDPDAGKPFKSPGACYSYAPTTDEPKASCRKLYGEILSNFTLWEKFGDYGTIAMCYGGNFLPSGESTLMQTYWDKSEELEFADTKRAEAKKLGKDTIYNYFFDHCLGSCATPIVGSNVLMHGSLVWDMQHPQLHVIGKPEIHPIHGLVFRRSPAATTQVISIADDGKAHHSGTTSPVAINYIYEDWPKDRPYFSADLSFLDKERSPTQSAETGLEFDTNFNCNRQMVDHRSYDDPAFPLKAAPTVKGLGQCGSHQFLATFFDDYNPANLFAGAKYPFVNSGWALHTYAPKWDSAKTQATISVNEVSNGGGSATGAFPGIPKERIDVYKAKFALSNMTALGKDASFKVNTIYWDLPSTARILSEKHWVQTDDKGNTTGGGGSSPTGLTQQSGKAESITFAMVRAPARNAAWHEYHATVGASINVTAANQPLDLRPLEKFVDRERPHVSALLTDDHKKFRINSKQINFSEDSNSTVSSSICSPDWEYRIVYEPTVRAIPWNFFDPKKPAAPCLDCADVFFAWERGAKGLGSAALLKIEIPVDDPILTDDQQPDAQTVQVTAWDKTAGGPLDKETYKIQSGDLDIPVVNLALTASKQSSEDVGPAQVPGPSLVAGCQDLSTYVVSTFSSIKIAAQLESPDLANSAYKDAKGAALPSLMCPRYSWKVEILDDQGEWIAFGEAPSPIKQAFPKKSKPVGYTLKGNVLGIQASPGRHSFRLTVSGVDGYGRRAERKTVFYNWWAVKVGGLDATANFLDVEATCAIKKARQLRKLAATDWVRAPFLSRVVEFRGGLVDPAPWMQRAAALQNGAANVLGPRRPQGLSAPTIAERMADLRAMDSAVQGKRRKRRDRP